MLFRSETVVVDAAEDKPTVTGTDLIVVLEVTPVPEIAKPEPSGLLNDTALLEIALAACVLLVLSVLIGIKKSRFQMQSS